MASSLNSQAVAIGHKILIIALKNQKFLPQKSEIVLLHPYLFSVLI
jgi:hypothetical protein